MHQGTQEIVLIEGCVRMLRGTERDDPRMAQTYFPYFGKEFVILRVGSRPAAFYVIYPELIELPGNADLVLKGKGYADGLGSITKGGVIDGNARFAQVSPKHCCITREG